jgi:hypothetical protein
VIGLILLTVAAALILAFALRRHRSQAPTVATPSSGRVVAPTASGPRPQSSETSPSRQARVVSTFPDGVSGTGLTVAVTRLPPSDVTCLTHSFDADPAYQSDCRSWPSNLSWFYVVIRNRSSQPIDFRLSRFQITDGNGQTYLPTDVRSKAGDPQHFLPNAASLGGCQSVAGWIAVEAGPDFVPARLAYHDGSQFLIVRFVGTHHVTPRS